MSIPPPRGCDFRTSQWSQASMLDTMTPKQVRLSTSCHLRRETKPVNRPVWEGV
jgi:hypothetical protein